MLTVRETNPSYPDRPIMPITMRSLAVASTQLHDECLAGRIDQDRLQRAREVVL